MIKISKNKYVFYSFTNKNFYLEYRLFLAIIMSILMIIADGKYDLFFRIKSYIEYPIYLSYYLCDKPYHVYNNVLKIFQSYTKIILENDQLKQELILKNNELLLLEKYKRDNHRLNSLLNFAYTIDRAKIYAEVFFINIKPWSYHIIINKGIKHGIYIGQPVISEQGIVGQIISVSNVNSRILLISDFDHALSVQIKRNDTHLILMGYGQNSDLRAECSDYIDVCIGDLLVTSGLDGRFPSGYSVAIVKKIIKNQERGCITIYAYPTFELKHLKYVILL